MNARPAVGSTRKPWAVRVWGNPLARSTDRAEAVLLMGLAVIWLLSLPLVATMASAEWKSVESRVLAEQDRDVAVDAVLQADVSPAAIDPRAPSMVQSAVAATWVGRDGQPTEGTVPVNAGARAGDHVTIWLDGTGSVVDRPMTTRTAAGILVAATVATWLALGLTFAVVWRGSRWLFDRRRSQSWADEWASFDAGRPAGAGGADGPD